jgi:hypothetical protein
MNFWNSANTISNAIWGTVESIGIIGAFIFGFAKLFKKIDKRLDQGESNRQADNAAMDKRMDKIEYALFNAGKTGLINKVDDLLGNQQQILTDIAVIKAKQ